MIKSGNNDMRFNFKQLEGEKKNVYLSSSLLAAYNLCIYFRVPPIKNSKLDRDSILLVSVTIFVCTEKQPFFWMSVSIGDLFPLKLSNLK